MGLPPDDDGGCGATANNDLTIAATNRQVASPDETDAGVGSTQVRIVVRFNGYIQSVDADGHTELLTDVLAGVMGRMDADLTAARADNTGLGLGSPAAVEGPTTTITYDAITQNAGALPMVRDLVDTDAGYDLSVTDADQTIAAATAVATGYAADNAGTTKVQEDKNGRSQVRLGRSSSVDAPS